MRNIFRGHPFEELMQHHPRVQIQISTGSGIEPWIVKMALPYFPLVLIRVPSL